MNSTVVFATLVLLGSAGRMQNPKQLAREAVQLNLRLMKWRASPQLDVAGVAGTRVLLLGAGTLG